MSAYSGPRLTVTDLAVVIDPKNTISKPVDTNILNPQTWAVGTGSSSGFSQNGSTSENHRILDTDPFGNQSVIWEARPGSASGADGGWNTSNFSIDKTKMYRYSTWVRRTVQGNGSFYLGCNGYGSTNGVLNRGNGSNNTNPYFWVAGTPTSIGVWTLIVGHVWPAGSGTGSFHPDSGRYTISGGKIGGISNDFVWRDQTTSARHRSYLYYSTNTSTRQQWCYPRVDVCDGTEPSIQDLLNNFPNDNYIHDATTGSQTGILLNNIGYTDGAYQFNGTNTSLFMDNPINSNGPYSIIQWVKPNVALADTTSSESRRTPLAGPGPTWNPGYWLTARVLRVHAKTEYRDVTINWVGDTGWHQVGQIFDGTNVWAVVDGKKILGTRTAYSPPSQTQILLGGENVTGGATNWNGQLGSLKFYNRALTASNVRKNYRAMKARYGV
jgi:hypothetical protein